MNSAAFVDQQIAAWKAEGKDGQWIAWNAALACVGWPYVFGARGEYCSPANRQKYYSAAHPTIKTSCKNFEGTGSCSGCKWYPNGKRVRCFDCRGFTYWILLQVYGWKLMGTGATSQWKDANNWKAKGEISTIPADTLVCLFVQKGEKMEHTGFGFNNETVECSSGVQHFTQRKAKWTHWGIPACIGGAVPAPAPAPTPAPAPDPQPATRPTIRKGNRNVYVKEMQTMLDKLGYNLGICGIDGDFGTATEKAVKEFQQDHKLTADGICGPKTWAALQEAVDRLREKPEPVKTYTVIISGLDLTQAQAIAGNYPGAARIVEGSAST